MTSEHRESARAQIGRPLLVGTVVGLAFVPIQLAGQDELRRQSERHQRVDEEAANHRELLLELSLRSDLRGIDLHGQNLADSYLVGKKLANANLSGADLQQANLAHADLRHADLTDTHFDGANLYRARLDRAVLKHTSFIGANLVHAHFSTINWRGGAHPGPTFFAPEPDRVFHSADASEDSPTEDINRTDFSRANLAWATFKRADLSASRFQGANLRWTEFDDVILEHADFARTKVIGFFNDVDLCRASFASAQLDGFLLYDGNLRYADLRSSSLAWVSLTHSDLRAVSASGLRKAPNSSPGLPTDLSGYDVTVSKTGSLTLPLTISRSFGAMRARTSRVPPCSWGIVGNRLRPRATQMPGRA
jgi:uncharacterized protein YjbI with pentapeptide repeats